MLLLVQWINAQKKYGITAGAGKTSLYKFPVLPEDYDSYSGQGSWWAGLVTDIPIVASAFLPLQRIIKKVINILEITKQALIILLKIPVLHKA
ncbi:MAG: hypothetical protein WDM90_09730 [Ferruginibacter sp.]